MNTSRKKFLPTGAATIGALLGRSLPYAQPGVRAAESETVVIAGHGNLEAVKEMLAEEPGLINGGIDCGKGDFETS